MMAKRMNQPVECRHILKRQQQGVILIVALIMLLVMTVAGVTTMTGSTLQEKIAGNQRQQMTARINADQGLKAAETYLDSLHPGNSINTTLLQSEFSSTNGLYTEVAPLGGGVAIPLAFDRLDRASWTTSNSVAVPNETNVLSRYTIEYVGAINEEGFANLDDKSGEPDDASLRKIFRITAIGFGDNANVFSILESYYFERSP